MKFKNIRAGKLAAAMLMVGSAIFAAAPNQGPQEQVYKMGDDITAPKVIEKVEPKYTDEARAARIAGTAVLSVVIGSDGMAHDINVISAPDPGLGVKAAEAVQQWKFSPGQKDGAAVAVRAQIEVNFKLL